MNLARCLENALENIEKTLKIDELNRIIEKDSKIHQNLALIQRHVDFQVKIREGEILSRLKICKSLGRLNENITGLALQYVTVLRSQLRTPGSEGPRDIKAMELSSRLRKQHLGPTFSTNESHEEEGPGALGDELSKAPKEEQHKSPLVCKEGEDIKHLLDLKNKEFVCFEIKHKNEINNIQKMCQKQRVSALLYSFSNSIDITTKMLSVHEFDNKKLARICEDLCHRKLRSLKALIKQKEEDMRRFQEEKKASPMVTEASDTRSNEHKEYKRSFMNDIDERKRDRMEAVESLRDIDRYPGGEQRIDENISDEKLLLKAREIRVQNLLLSLRQKLISIEGFLGEKVVDKVLVVLSQGSLENDVRFAKLIDQTLKDMEKFDSPEIARMSIQFVIAKKYVEDMITLKEDSLLCKYLERK